MSASKGDRVLRNTHVQSRAERCIDFASAGQGWRYAPKTRQKIPIPPPATSAATTPTPAGASDPSDLSTIVVGDAGTPKEDGLLVMVLMLVLPLVWDGLWLPKPGKDAGLLDMVSDPVDAAITTDMEDVADRDRLGLLVLVVVVLVVMTDKDGQGLLLLRGLLLVVVITDNDGLGLVVLPLPPPLLSSAPAAAAPPSVVSCSASMERMVGSVGRK